MTGVCGVVTEIDDDGGMITCLKPGIEAKDRTHYCPEHYPRQEIVDLIYQYMGCQCVGYWEDATRLIYYIKGDLDFEDDEDEDDDTA